MIFDQVIIAMTPTAPIPGTNYIVKGLGTTKDGQPTLVYYIPNNRNPQKRSEKSITRSECQQAYDQLLRAGEFTRKWFNEVMPERAATAPCNFRAIGQTFVFLGIAGYRRGTYTRRLP